jgi:hypothetical protein
MPRRPLTKQQLRALHAKSGERHAGPVIHKLNEDLESLSVKIREHKVKINAQGMADLNRIRAMIILLV